MKKISIALALCASLVAGVAAAAPRWDSNGDGTVDAQEKAVHREQMKAKRAEMKQKMLQQFDANRDGTLDDNERAIMREQFAVEAFKRLDKDGNGQISFDEFKQAKQGKRFGKQHHRGARRGDMKVR